MNQSFVNYTPEMIAKMGDQFYFDELKDKLEKTNFGHYVVIEVESKKYFIDEDLSKALNKARTEFPNKLFHIIKIGSLQKLAKIYRSQEYEWLF